MSNDLTLSRIEASNMRNEINQLNFDAGRTEKKVVTELSEALLEFKFDVILDHVNVA